MDKDFFLHSQSQMPPWKLITTMNCSNTLNSPPPMPIMDHFVKENLPNLRNSIPVNLSPAADAGFAERAAKFSCFGSRSFNGRNSQMGLSTLRSSVSPLMGNAKLPRVSSTPALKINGSASGSGSAANSNEESSVSEQLPCGLNSRKRKAVTSRGKDKQIASPIPKEEGNDDSSSKRVKKTEEVGQSEGEKIIKAPEPPKDYIHVRARRGQATDSHSLAERVRREKISERMKFLQDLVPGCNKVTGKALMLDEIINYVQSLQRQVEFLSMKLATVNPRLDSDMNSQLSKDMNQSTENLCQQLYPIDSAGQAFYQQTPQVHLNGPPSVQGFTESFLPYPAFGEDDLHSIFQMGLGEILNQDTPFLHETPNQTSEMKIEL